MHAGSLLREGSKWQMIGPEEGRKYDNIGAIALLTSPVNTPCNADPRAKKSHASCIRARNA